MHSDADELTIVELMMQKGIQSVFIIAAGRDLKSQ